VPFQPSAVRRQPVQSVSSRRPMPRRFSVGIRQQGASCPKTKSWSSCTAGSGSSASFPRRSTTFECVCSVSQLPIPGWAPKRGRTLRESQPSILLSPPAEPKAMIRRQPERPGLSGRPTGTGDTAVLARRPRSCFSGMAMVRIPICRKQLRNLLTASVWVGGGSPVSRDEYR
jgi:hypothetical protein